MPVTHTDNVWALEIQRAARNELEDSSSFGPHSILHYLPHWSAKCHTAVTEAEGKALWRIRQEECSVHSRAARPARGVNTAQ